MKRPHIQFYTGDWMKDPQLSMCSPATRGIWMDLICAMHEKDQCGELSGTTEQLCRLARCSVLEFENFVYEINTHGAAKLEKQGDIITIANRRMKKMAELRGKRAEAGRSGGLANRSKPKMSSDIDNDIGTERVLTEYCISLGLPATDGAAVFAKWEGNNWTNGGQPIRDWKATIRSWKLQGYMPSQRPQGNSKGAPAERNIGWKRATVLPAVEQPASPEFQKQLADWIARGRPLGEDPLEAK